MDLESSLVLVGKSKLNPSKLKNLFYWFVGINSISVAIFTYTQYQSTGNEILKYDSLLGIFTIILVAWGIMFIARPISELLARNRKVQKWYIEFEAKKWRKQ